MLRTDFKPATTLNILAAAWLQFQTRDWFHHDTNTDRMIEVPRPPGDDWPDDPILMPSTPSDPTAPPDQSTNDIHQHGDPLVGRFPNLRQHPGVSASRPHE